MSNPFPSPSSYAPTTPARPRQKSLTRQPSSNLLATPRTARPPLLPTTSSPAYATSLRSRHSLYGTEDRVVLDLGSRVWKVGFSGEGAPRECRGVLSAGGEVWGLEKGEVGEEEWEVREQRLKSGLRDVWFNNLMSDPKARKVIVIESPLLPTQVKEMIARVLFDNLQVPSISFASSHLLSLMATGTVTGLVVDCGNLETTVLPIFSSRPLFPLLLSTPVAGARMTSRLRALLLQFGSFVPPPSTLNSTAAPVRTKIPRDLLSEELVEEIKTRVCFVGEALEDADEVEELFGEEDARMEDDVMYDEAMVLRKMERRYASRVTATTLSFKVPNLSLPPVASGVGRGWIQIPGWVRERAAEVLFEEGNEDERSVTEVVLEALLRLPRDLRKPLASSILVTGGTPMLPGFFPRLRHSLLSTLSASHPPSTPPTPPPSSPTTSIPPHRRALASRLSVLRSTPHFAPLIPLSPHLAITNDPSSTSSFPGVPLHLASGQAPAFAPALLGWVGGSLAGALKTGGEEIGRERWDEKGEEERRVLPDWTTMRIRVA